MGAKIEWMLIKENKTGEKWKLKGTYKKEEDDTKRKINNEKRK